MKPKKILSAILAAAITVAAVVPSIMKAEGEGDNTRDPETINVQATPETDESGTTIFTVDAQKETLMSLPYSDVNESVGRNTAGYYLGFKVYAPKDYTGDVPIYKKIYKYLAADATTESIINEIKTNGTGGGSFDGTEDGFKFMGCWMNVKYEFMTACLEGGTQAGKQLVYALAFNWDNDDTYEQVVIVKANPADITGGIEDFYFNYCRAGGHDLDAASGKCTICGKEKIGEIAITEPEAAAIAFGEDCPDVAGADDTKYTAETEWTNEDGEEATDFSKNGEYTAKVTLTAKPGKYFDKNITAPENWEKDADSTDGTITISKTFEISGGFTVDVNTTGNGTAAADKEQAKEGAEITITAEPDSGWKLDNITVTYGDNEPVAVNEENKFTMPAANVTVTVTFVEKEEHDVTVSAVPEAEGAVTVDPTTAKEGDTVTITVTPAKGYERDTLTVATADGDPVTVESDDTFVMPDADVTVTAAFKKTEYSVTLTAPTNGAAEVDKTTATLGDTVSVTGIEPAEGYELDKIEIAYTDDGEAKTDDITEGKSFEMPAADVIVTVTFKTSAPASEPHDIKVAAGIKNGTVSVDKTTAEKGETVKITVTPAEGYKLEKITVVSEGTEITVTDDYEFEMPDADVTVSAEFTAILYKVEIIAPENGSVKAEPTNAAIGTEVTIIAEAKEGYELDSITVTYGDSKTVEVKDNKFTMPASDVTVTVTFKAVTVEKTYKVTVTETENGTVEVDPTEAKEGAEVTITATPAENYELDKLTVTDSESKAVEVKDNKFTMPASDVTVTATFKKAEEPTPSVTDEPTPTVTDEPTPTVTDEPTPTVTDEPTPTVTDEPTPTVTDEPTPTVTDEPTPTVTDEPTPTVTDEPNPPAPEEPEIITGSAEAEAPVDAEEGLEINVEELDVVLSAEPDTFGEDVKSVRAEVEVNDEIPAEKENGVNEAVEAVAAEGEQAEISSVISITLKDQDGNPVQPVNGGVVTVTIPHDGKSNYAVYIDGDKPEFIKLTIANGYASFGAKHFSDYYIVALSEKAAEAVDKANEDNSTETEAPVPAPPAGSFVVPVVSGGSPSDNTTTPPAQTEPLNTSAPVSSEENAAPAPSSSSAAADGGNNAAQNTTTTPVPDNGNGNADNGNDNADNGNGNADNGGSGNGSVGNDGAGSSQDKNAATGLALELIPLLAVTAVGVLVSKKKK